MAVANILAGFNGSPSAEAALAYAASLARPRGAHVTAMLAHTTHEVVDVSSRWIPAEARALIGDAKRRLIEEVEARFDALRPGLDLGERLSWRRASGRVDVVLAEAARSFDMIVVGRHLDADDGHLAHHPDRIALLSGRPVVVVPEGHDADASHSHAALAWDGGRAAARALSDSLALLEDDGRVTLLTVGARPDGVDDVLAHLARHGVAADHVAHPAGLPVAEALLAFCRDRDPCFLAMGAYEHSKFREDLLGGVTARVLRDARTPVLMSH